MPQVRARAALLTVALSGVALGACSTDAESPERADLKPVAESRAPGTPVLEGKPAVPREKARERKRRRAKPRKRREAGIQKAAAPSPGGAAPARSQPSAPSRPAPVADAPAPAPPAAQPAPPAAQPPKPPAGSGGGGDSTRAKPTEVECAPRCP